MGVSNAIEQLYSVGTRFYFVNGHGDCLEDLYLTVATLPDAEGVGIMKSVDEEATTVDICYRIKADGSMHGWVSLDGEHEASILPLHPRVNRSGEVEEIKIEFSGGYMAEYRVCSFDDYHFPSEEIHAKDLCMVGVDF